MTDKTTSSSNPKKRRTYEQKLIDKARNMQEALDLEIYLLQNILNDALSQDTYLDWDSMKRSPLHIPFKDEPKLKDYVPETSGNLDNMPLIWKVYFEQQYGQGKSRYLADKAAYDTRVKSRRENVDRRNRKSEQQKLSFFKGRPRAVKSYFNKVLHASKYPPSFPKQYRLDYMADSRHLIVEYELPSMDIVPAVKEHRYTRKLSIITQTPMARQLRIQLTESVIAQIALRTIHEIFQADRTEKVDLIWFKGYAKVTDQITNKDIRLPVVRINITRRQFLDIDLSSVDPVKYLKDLDRKFSPNLARLVSQA